MLKPTEKKVGIALLTLDREDFQRKESYLVIWYKKSALYNDELIISSRRHKN
jgi:hypothetical protein